MLEVIQQPWPWHVSGLMIALIMFTLLFFGKSFGFSANLRTMCSMAGAGKKYEFFNFDWQSQKWNLTFLLGSVIGGFIAVQFLSPEGYSVNISEATIQDLKAMGVDAPSGLQPDNIFGGEFMWSLGGMAFLLIGGFMIGFGARYGGGCTSGHAISGLSDLQVPSLIAVVGFFIGGLLMTHFILPNILPLLF